MDVVHARCCGLDVHKKSVVACALITQWDGSVERHMRTFGTVTTDLLKLADWLSNLQVTQVAMESTGVYWRPVFNVLEDDERTIVLVNPQHMRAVPGKKTDVKDAEWITDLLRHGLLRASFIPPAPIRAIRELTRYRKTLVQERADEKRDPDVLADLAQGRLRAKLPQLREALQGRVQPQHLVLIEHILAHIDFLTQTISEVQAAIERCLPSYEEALTLLQTIPGVKPIAAAAILAEIGTDMSRFPSAGHLASWAGLCPSNKESAGKRMKAPMNHGNVWLRAIMGEVAWASIRTRATYFHAQFGRIARRRGAKKAAVAVAHSLLIVIYHVLRDGNPYNELGADYFNNFDSERVQRHHVRRLEQLGYKVSLTPMVA